MHNTLPSITFYTLLFILFIIEGWGAPYNINITFPIIIFLPLILFLMSFFTKKNIIRVPIKLVLFWLFFVLAVFSTTIFSVDIGRSFEHRLFYTAVFLTCLFVYNYQKNLIRLFPIFIWTITITTIFFTTFIGYLAHRKLFLTISSGTFNFAQNSPGMGHDIRGVFVTIPLALLLGMTLHKPSRDKIIWTIIFLSLLLMSFFRAGYLAVIIVTMANFRKWNKGYVKKYIYSSIIAIFIFILLLSLNIFSGDKKSSVMARTEMLSQAFQSIRDHPLTGIGSYNFYYASIRYAKKIVTIAGSSHNILLDIAVENGIPAFLFFSGSLFLLTKNISRTLRSRSTIEHGIYSLFVSLFVLFLFSHYHKMYWLFLFFFTIAILLYKERNEILIKTKWLLVLSMLIAIINSYTIWAKIALYRGYSTQSINIYPIYAAGYQQAAATALSFQNYKATADYLEKYSIFYSKNPLVMEFIANKYKLMGNNERALAYYQKALVYWPYNFSYLREVVALKEKIEGYPEAEKFIKKYIDSKNLIKNNPDHEETRTLLSWCKEHHYNCGDN